MMRQQSSQQAPPRQWTNLDFKRPKIDVYVANDIFNQCANPLETEDNSTELEEDRVA